MFAVLIVVVFALPLTVGALAGARYSNSVCAMIFLAMLGVMVGPPLLAHDYLLRSSVGWIKDIVLSFGLVALLGSWVMVGEFVVGVQLGRRHRRETDLGRRHDV